MPLFNSILTNVNKLQYKKPAIDVIINLIELQTVELKFFTLMNLLVHREKINFDKQI